jgi:thioredoxin 1
MIDFWAPWCTQCKALTPLVEELAGAYGDKILFAQCNLTENTPIAVKYGIRSIPTFLFLKKGQVIEQLYGMISKNQFEKVLKTLTENP